MVTINDFTIKYDHDEGGYKVTTYETLYCPLCGGRLSGYDTRRRHIVDAAGDTYWLLLPRLRCTNCKSLHVAAPPFIRPKKHYAAAVIADVQAGHTDQCPADNSTIRRWRR